MLKKKWRMLALLAFGVSSSGLVQASNDGTIQFTGTISAAACSIQSVAGANSTVGTVSFGSNSSALLSTAGATTLPVPFTIELNHCAVSSAPSITFNGTAVTTASYTELFATPVTGIGIRLEDAGKSGSFYIPGISTSNSGLDVLTSDTVTSATGRF